MVVCSYIWFVYVSECRKTWITGVCSPHVIYLCDFVYYVRGRSMKLLFVVCMLVGIVVWAKVDYVSSVNCVQSTFLKFVKIVCFVVVYSHVVY